MIDKKIYIAGHRGMVGSALERRFRAEGCRHLLLRSHQELDLTSQAAVNDFFQTERPEIVIVAAAKVGGIYANKTYPAEFLDDNLAIASNLIRAAYEAGTERLLFLGSSCIYPKHAPQPMTEDALLTGPLESTNEAYAIAKIAGIKLCQAFRQQYGVCFHSALPSNLYGPGDNYHPQNSHVLPALIRKFHEAREAGDASVTAWGSGQPRREFLHVDDLADACRHLLRISEPPDWVNIGTGTDVSIAELAETVRETVGFQGEIDWDTTMPDGTPRKLLDVTKMKRLGWESRISLKRGIEQTYRAFLDERSRATVRA